MEILDIVGIYTLCGIGFSVALEYLMHWSKFEQKTITQNWERVFWITCWPFCLAKFLMGYFKG